MAGVVLVAASRGRSSAVQAFGQVVTQLRAMVRARATRRMLLEMDTRELADIGIGRGEAIMEARRSFWDIERRRRS